MPKILFINHWAKQLGGAEYSLLDIMRTMHSHAELHLLTSEPGRLVDAANAIGVQSHTLVSHFPMQSIRRDHLIQSALHSWKSLFSFLHFIFRTHRLIKNLRPDCIHANVPKSHVTLFILARLGYKGTCCFHVRELFKARSLPTRLYSVLFPHKNAHILAISQAVKDALPPRLQHYSRVIYNGIAVAASGNRLPKQDNGLRFLYLGRMVPWKGCHILIRAFASLVKQYPAEKLSLALVGDTLYWPQTYRQELHTQIQALRLQNFCTLAPHTDTPLKTLLDHDIFCSASCEEPFGRSLAEALGCGLPVISFSGGGVVEIIEDQKCGLVVPYGDEEKFLSAMAYFVEHPDQIKIMGKAGHERAEKLFNRDIQMPIISNFILELVKR